jgi:protein TonB
MELKKSVKADLEWRKPTFIQIGLVVSLLVVYLAFELVGSKENTEVITGGGLQVFDDEKVIQTEQPKDIPPPPPQQMAVTLIEIVSDNIRLEDFTIDVESSEHLQVDEVAFVEDTKEAEVKEEVPFVVVEVMPEYPGGDEARLRFLSDNLVYPTFARNAGLEGKVTIGFVVEPDGRLTNFTILRGVAPALDEEALRVVKMMPKWKPGKQRGKAVRVQYQLPITFTLN